MFNIQAFLGHEDPKTTSLYVTDAGTTLLLRMRANPVFNDEVKETLPQDQGSRLEAKLDELTSIVVALMQRSAPVGEDGLYPLHEALQLGGGLGHRGDAIADEEPPQ